MYPIIAYGIDASRDMNKKRGMLDRLLVVCAATMLASCGASGPFRALDPASIGEYGEWKVVPSNLAFVSVAGDTSLVVGPWRNRHNGNTFQTAVILDRGLLLFESHVIVPTANSASTNLRHVYNADLPRLPTSGARAETVPPKTLKLTDKRIDYAVWRSPDSTCFGFFAFPEDGRRTLRLTPTSYPVEFYQSYARGYRCITNASTAAVGLELTMLDFVGNIVFDGGAINRSRGADAQTETPPRRSVN